MRFKIILNKDAAFVDYINILLNNQNYFMPVDLTGPLEDLYNVDAKYDEKFNIIKNKYNEIRGFAPYKPFARAGSSAAS